MLHLGMLQDTLGAEHGSIVLTIELDFLRWMDLTVSNSVRWLVLSISLSLLGVRVLNSHGQGGENLVVDRKVFRSLMMRDLIVWAFDHLMLVQLSSAFETERMTTWQRDWLLIVMIVWLEANATFENLIHLFGLRPVVPVLIVLVFRLLKWGICKVV